MEQLIFKGLISESYRQEKDDVLCVDGLILAEEFEYLKGKQVSVRYWISDVERDKDQIQEAALLALVGSVYARFEAAYSEYTGYLWTDEDLEIGGHDLLSELSSHKDKYVYLEVDVYNSSEVPC